MIAVQMIVRVDQSGMHIGIAALDNDVELATFVDDPISFDRDCAVTCLDQRAHAQRSRRKARASTTRRPK